MKMMMKEKGKTKSEKVWMALLFTFSLLLFTVTAGTALAVERVALLDVHQEGADGATLSYSYQTLELNPAISYKLVTTVRVKSGLPGVCKWQVRVYTNDVTEANAIVTTSINLRDAFGQDINTDGNINLSLIGADSTPVGTIVDFAGRNVPNGYLLCNGQTVSRSTYARLFAVIGTTYGTGDGSTTFALPNFSGRVAQGPNGSWSLGQYPTVGAPNITGSYNKTSGNGGIIHASSGGVTREGAFFVDKTKYTYYFGEKRNSTVVRGWVFNAASGECGTYTGVSGSPTYVNNVYGKSITVQPAAVVVNKVIKY